MWRRIGITIHVDHLLSCFQFLTVLCGYDDVALRKADRKAEAAEVVAVPIILRLLQVAAVPIVPVVPKFPTSPPRLRGRRVARNLSWVVVLLLVPVRLLATTTCDH